MVVADGTQRWGCPSFLSDYFRSCSLVAHEHERQCHYDHQVVVLEKKILILLTPCGVFSCDFASEIIPGEIAITTLTLLNSGTAIGYGPFVDVVLGDASLSVEVGTIVAGPEPPTKLQTSCMQYAELLGIRHELTCVSMDPVSSCAAHPFVRDSAGEAVSVCATATSQLCVFLLPVAGYTPASPALEVRLATRGSTVVSGASLHVALSIRAGILRKGLVFLHLFLTSP